MPNGHNMEHGTSCPNSHDLISYLYVVLRTSVKFQARGMFRSLFETAELQPQERPPHCLAWSYLLCAFAVDSTDSAMYSM